ncbi:MAG TPA: hypothetical protein DC042_15475 [Bacteroidales bacterium]|nr:hypothetical protein [Bacteroidales bacterium]
MKTKIALAVLILTGGTLLGQKLNPPPMTELDLLITNARVIDGTGKPAFTAEIGIYGDQIIWVSEHITMKAKKTLDAAGRVVAPGFIDIHTHCDEGLDQKATHGNLNYLMQGTTSVVTGNCGDGTADIGAWTDKLSVLGIGTNALPLTGFGWLRQQVMGRDDRRPTTDEMKQMKDLLRKSLENGSWGLSTGLQYVPQKYADAEEIIELAKLLKESDGLYATHMRSEEDELLAATREAVRIAKEAGVRLNIAHLKANGRKNWPAMEELIGMVNKEIKNGMLITADMYPYDKSQTTPLVSVLLAPEALKLTSISEWQRALRDGVTRDAIRLITENGRVGGTNWVAKGGWNFFSIVNAPKHPEMVGKMIIDLAEKLDKSPFDVAADLVISEGDDLIISLSTMKEENLRFQMKQPWVMFSSDGYAVNPNDKGVHPRNYGSQARVIRKYVEEEKILTLEKAISKMTALPAAVLGLTDRGLIMSGFKADLVIFDPGKVRDPATYLDPHRFATGIDMVILNGVPVVVDGKFIGKYAGRVLKK